MCMEPPIFQVWALFLVAGSWSSPCNRRGGYLRLLPVQPYETRSQSSRFHRSLSNPQTAQILGIKPEKAKEVRS
jgi:hypothetical protein